VLRVDDVSVSFGTTRVLDHVSLVVPAATTVALLGPSGAGKTTLLRVVAGLTAPSAGRVIVDGVDVTTVPTHRRGVAMVFQGEHLFPHRDVAANVAFGLKMAKVPRARADQRVAEMLALVGLSGFERRSVTTLSGGEAKRVALARALAPRPALVLLDEPLTGLDRDLHDRLAREVRAILASAGVSAVLVTHDRAEAEMMADVIVDFAELSGAGQAVVTLEASQTHPLRRSVLRRGTPSKEVTYAQDDLDTTVHLGVQRGGRIVAVSSWAPEAWSGAPGVPAVRLRGMAVDWALQGTGVGAALVAAGIERAWADEARLVWASARDSALSFYRAMGFEVVGEVFIDAATGMDHHFITLSAPG
jgi:thiamine transport system ATP-binding protein